MIDVKARQKFEKRMGALRNERDSQGWKAHWQEISDYLLPRRGRYLASRTNDGRKLNTHIIDSTGTKALRDGAAGLMAGITSAARPWFGLAIPDPDLMEYGPVREWLDIVRDRMRDIFSRSNLYGALAQGYEEILAFGQMPIGSTENRSTVLHFEPYTAGEYFIAQSDMGKVNTFYREYPVTVAQLVQWFVALNGQMNWANVSPTVKNLWDCGATEEWVPIVHAVEENDERIKGSPFARNKAFRSVWYETGDTRGNIMRWSGFNEFPIPSARWWLTGNDIYARSPGMDALPDIKQLQVMQKRSSQAIDKMVNPPMVADATLKGQAATVLPGQVTYIDSAVYQQVKGSAFTPAYQVNFDVQKIEAKIADTRMRVREHFFADLFLMFASSDRREVTAEEIRARQEEKLLMLGPVLERFHNDLLDPIIDRTFMAMLRAGLVPPPPAEMQGMDLTVEYISVMAQAQKSIGTYAIESTVNFAAGLLGLGFTDAGYKIDAEQAVDEYARLRGAPSKIIRTDEQVANMKAAEAKAKQNAENINNAAATITAAKTLSETKTDDANALTDALGSMGVGRRTAA